jgi:hypothetical protein
MWAKVFAAIMLIIALGNLPYRYFTVLRWVVFLVSLRAGADAGKTNSVWWALGFLAIAIVFNPFLPLRLDRDIWQLTDIASALFFGASIPFVDLAEARHSSTR